MSNFWLKKDALIKVHKSIDDKAMDCWAMNQTFGEFLDSLTKEELDYLGSFKIKDFAADPFDPSFGLELNTK